MARRDDDEEGVSLKTADGIESSGRFGPGPATINTARFADFTYTPKEGSGKKKVTAPVLLVTYERDGVEEKVPYSVGSGWRVSKNGLKLIPRNGQEGLPTNCNAFYFLESLEEAGMPKTFLDTPDQLDGFEVVLMAKPMNRDFGDRGKDAPKSNSTLLVVEEITGGAPFVKGSSKKKASKKDDDEDEDEPVTKKKKKAAADDEDDEEDTPKGKKGASAKGKKDDEDDDDLDENAIEALIDLLADGPMKVDELEGAARTALKGNPQRLAIAARLTEDNFLELEKGWTFNAKKQSVEKD